MRKLLSYFVLLALMGVSVEGMGQMLVGQPVGWLKGNVSVLKEIDYSIYPDIISSRSVSYFDAQGRLISAISSDSLQSPANIWRFKYDNKGKLFKIISVKNGTTRSVYTNIYNSRGYLIQQNLSTVGRSYFKPPKYFFKYNEQGKMVEIIKDEYGVDIRLKRKVFTYDRNGLVSTESTFNKYGYLEDKTYMMYNKNRDVVKLIFYPDVMVPDKSTKSLYSYIYDKKGNWIIKKMKDSLSDKFEIIQTRAITYRH